MDQFDTQRKAEDAVVREALNSTWNVSGGDRVTDMPDNPDREICHVAWCGLDQGILSCIASFDSTDVFGKSQEVADNLVKRSNAMIASLRRVVEKGVKDGVLVPVDTSHRYSLGVTFAEGRDEL